MLLVSKPTVDAIAMKLLILILMKNEKGWWRRDVFC